jgi:pimeloyl-ACP methyl ester carboxylesterase
VKEIDPGGETMREFASPMEPWPALASYGQYVTLPAGGLQLFTFQAGDADAPAALLIHGLGDEADTWRHLLPALATNQRVVALDLPGFGRSDQPDTNYTPDFLQRTLVELMDVLGLDDVLLVGSSLGAMLAQSLAPKLPDRIRGLALLDGTLVARGNRVSLPMLLFSLPKLGEYLYTRLRKDPDAAYATLRPFYFNLDGLPQADQDFLYRRVNQRVWSDGQRRAYFSMLRNMGPWRRKLQGGLPKLLEMIDTPTVAIWGEADQILPVASGQALAEMQASAQLITIARAGHLPQQERPDAVLEALRINGLIE